MRELSVRVCMRECVSECARPVSRFLLENREVVLVRRERKSRCLDPKAMSRCRLYCEHVCARASRTMNVETCVCVGMSSAP